ncbi:type III toxin-antitoxin system ToxN/AbiQ family toxin [Xanthomonas campestris]|nr:type III toxin-antitoxin system ToxN/AbiQ family toxin [Xanthomonas campestris]MEA9520987.1 type III toxin-antitoxin system ToxN/AbiQ family toxin [Xanthomonas campestris]MEB1829554.1 type III toxin-antitoxin system ToxN/AbiQ family toxin [Xanthomonas campestris pv. campestris]MEB1874288.1 type III toxin-antitoxin system ToxN/AbiQ family toxin [Xanthomonas campestris pv. campestris]
MGKGMKFYVVTDCYVDHLRQFDAKVSFNKAGRPYIGIVLEIQAHHYFAPLTSPKPKHDSIRDSLVTVFKLYDIDDPANKLGMIQLNNMIPAPASEVSLLDFSTLDQKYCRLLSKQLRCIKTKQDDIRSRAAKLHKIVSGSAVNGLSKSCCDFKELEARCAAFEMMQKAVNAPLAPDTGTTEVAEAG